MPRQRHRLQPKQTRRRHFRPRVVKRVTASSRQPTQHDHDAVISAQAGIQASAQGGDKIPLDPPLRKGESGAQWAMGEDGVVLDEASPTLLGSTAYSVTLSSSKGTEEGSMLRLAQHDRNRLLPQDGGGRRRILILGAAGRDFHNFNLVYRDNPDYHVVGFTATQIPDIEGRTYPAELAGSRYPKGIPIFDEKNLSKLVHELKVDEVVFAYSDVTHNHVMHLASIAQAAGAGFRLLSPRETMLTSSKPVVAVCAVRTGSGKSQTSRAVVQYLSGLGHRVVAIRHPMPYGDLAAQAVQRFASYDDFEKHDCTIEEREEYEPYIEQGLVIYAGVDYERILSQAEAEADIILWDGGNNDTPFIKPDLHLTVVDPHRAGHELHYHPGETNLRMADVLLVNKMNTASAENIQTVLKNIQQANPHAKLIKADSAVTLDRPEVIRSKSVIVVEDGPTLTHGEMSYGAGVVAAMQFRANRIVDPRPVAVGSIAQTYEKFPHLHNVLPAMGYGEIQRAELEETINRSQADAVVVGTPIDLARLLRLNKPAVRVSYELAVRADSETQLADVLDPIGLKVMSLKLKADSSQKSIKSKVRKVESHSSVILSPSKDATAEGMLRQAQHDNGVATRDSSVATLPRDDEYGAAVSHGGSVDLPTVSNIDQSDIPDPEHLGFTDLITLTEALVARPDDYGFELDRRSVLILADDPHSEHVLIAQLAVTELGGQPVIFAVRPSESAESLAHVLCLYDVVIFADESITNEMMTLLHVTCDVQVINVSPTSDSLSAIIRRFHSFDLDESDQVHLRLAAVKAMLLAAVG